MKTETELEIHEWKWFPLTGKNGLFDLDRGTRITKKDRIPGNTPLATAGFENQGIAELISDEGRKLYSNTLTIDMFGNCFYRGYNFFADDNILVLKSKHPLSEQTCLFLSLIISRDKYKYSYGRQYRIKDAKKHIIRLPTKDANTPDWDFMEKYIETLKHKHIETKNQQKAPSLDTYSWKEFQIKELFTIKKGKRLTKSNMVEGSLNYIGAIDNNNGVRQKIDADAQHIDCCITVNYNGSVGEAFYQEQPFWASDDVNILYLNDYKLNKYIAMFLITVIKMNQNKFSYGRKWTKDKMEDELITLPIMKDGAPDWQYMEKYIMNLPYGDRI